MKRNEITRLFQSLTRSLVAQHRQHERERPGGVFARIEAKNKVELRKAIKKRLSL
nr:MAG TPA: hypothetical protein [Caudoviricetes sp.]